MPPLPAPTTQQVSPWIRSIGIGAIGAALVIGLSTLIVFHLGHEKAESERLRALEAARSAQGAVAPLKLEVDVLRARVERLEAALEALRERWDVDTRNIFRKLEEREKP